MNFLEAFLILLVLKNFSEMRNGNYVARRLNAFGLLSAEGAIACKIAIALITNNYSCQRSRSASFADRDRSSEINLILDQKADLKAEQRNSVS